MCTSTLREFYSILWCTEPLYLYSESIRISTQLMTTHSVHACISKLKGHTILKIAYVVWECSINLFSKSLTYRWASKQNSLFVNQFFGILIYSGKFISLSLWLSEHQKIDIVSSYARWEIKLNEMKIILCPKNYRLDCCTPLPDALSVSCK